MSNLSPISSNARKLHLLLASTMTVMAGATLAPALPGMQAAFAALPQSEFWVKMTMSLPGLMIALCAPFAGMLLDKPYKKVMLISAMLLYAATGVIGYLSPDSLWTILASRAALGVAVAFIMVGCTTLAGHYFQGPKLAGYMGLQAAFGGFGGVVFLYSAGLLADIEWHYVFTIYLLALLIVPGVLLFINEPEKTGAPPTKQGIPAQSELNKASLVTCYVLAGCEILVLYGITLNLPFMLQFLALGSPSETGFMLSFFLLAMSLCSLGYGKLSARFSIAAIHFTGWTMIGLGLVAVSLFETEATLLASLTLVGIGLGVIRPNLIFWLFSFTPLHLRGKMIGGITTCFFLGQFISPILMEPVVQLYGELSGYKALFLIIGILSLLTTGGLGLRYFARQKFTAKASTP
ncbi:MFS transporter [Veronia pacifica]|uniref:Major facilitator superfamily (MFS) profile domain-containing protein n=1 Tax=Veronia pacifica TaxID=1080227 RepID=A0A1C3EJY1_9GAMM|nr:MFS transporter [Veronia pacifica]ODA33538.1 hypothetical protein A8L45_10030 [Veronia pacifica]